MMLNSFEDSISSHTFDPYSEKQLNRFDALTFYTDQISIKPAEMQSSISERCLENQDQNTSTYSKHPLKKDSFQATSGVWGDTLSRGMIDLNILSIILA